MNLQTECKHCAFENCKTLMKEIWKLYKQADWKHKSRKIVWPQKLEASLGNRESLISINKTDFLKSREICSIIDL